MTMHGLYAELKGWQSAIGSAMGFIALIAAALFNFYLSRRRDAESRREEATAVAAALYGELLLLQSQLAQAASAVASLSLGLARREIDAALLDTHRLGEPVLYPALAAKLGLLDPEIVLSITAFHTDYQSARAALPLIVARPGLDGAHNVVLFLRPAVEAVESVEDGLERMEAMFGGRHRHQPPDVRAAQDVLELEM